MPAQQDVDVAAPVPAEQAPVAGGNPPQARGPGLTADRRLWIRFTGVALLRVASARAAPKQAGRYAGRRHRALRRATFTVPTRVLALPLAVGITDPPVLALFCVALACLGAGP